MLIKNISYKQIILFVFLTFSLTAISSTENPSVIWQKNYGGEKIDGAFSIIELNDGFICAGESGSFDSLSSAYVFKIDKNGNTLWEKTYNGIGMATASDIIQTTEGFVIAGQTMPIYGGLSDAYIIAVDKNGNLIWDKTFGGNGFDYAYSIIEVKDGYIFAGETGSVNPWSDDIYLVKINKKGNKIWEKTYGGKKDDNAFCIKKDTDGFIIAGYTSSFGAGKYDVYILKIDTEGNLLWQKTYGGNNNDRGWSITVIDDAYIIAGDSNSYNSDEDAYIIKTDKNGKLIWQKTFGISNFDSARSVIEVSDGYIFTGGSFKDNNIFLIKVDTLGNKIWEKRYGGDGQDFSKALIKTKNGCMIVGSSSSFGNGLNDAYIINIKF